MPPKKKDSKKGGEPDPRADPEMFLKQYRQFCKVTNITPWEQVCDAFIDDEDHSWKKEFVIHPKDPHDLDEPRLGPGGCRALCTSILGTGSGLTDPWTSKNLEMGPGKVLAGGSKERPNFMVNPFIDVKGIRIWWSRIGDEGAAAVAELLRLGGAEVALSYVELWDNGIGPSGCLALGKSLSIGWNKSLVGLALDYNTSIGADGVATLCRGLRTNQTLKKLSLTYCQITAEGAAPLADMLSKNGLALEKLILQGNKLGDDGLRDLCPGLDRNRSLKLLDLQDNGIGGNEKNLQPMKDFAQVLKDPPLPGTLCVLETINLNYNWLVEPVCDLLNDLLHPKDDSDPEGLKRGNNKRIKEFEVDTNLPDEVFEKLNYKAAKGGGKKKGGKKKKK